MTRIILVRHGRTEWNRIERFRGHADILLDEMGLKQAQAAAARIAGEWPVQAVYASPLSRARATAEAIALPFGLTVIPHMGLTDIDYGEWQALTPDEVRHQWPEMLDTWYDRPHVAHIPSGETLDAVRARAMAAVEEASATHPAATIVLVGHTVVNRLVLLGVLGLANQRFWRMRQDPCAINVFEAEAGDYTLLSLNDTCHLRGLG